MQNSRRDWLGSCVRCGAVPLWLTVLSSDGCWLLGRPGLTSVVDVGVTWRVTTVCCTLCGGGLCFCYFVAEG